MTSDGIKAASPKKVFGIFAGLIDQTAVQRLSNALSIASQQGVDEVHLLLQTSGGIIGDGVCLYNIFRSSPVSVSLYNAGTIASIGVIVFLGADHCNTSTNATFMIHKTTFSPIAATVDRLQSAAFAATLDDQRVEAILHEHINLPEEKWGVHKFADLWLSASEAVEAGVADAIADFSPPKGEQIYYVGPA